MLRYLDRHIEPEPNDVEEPFDPAALARFERALRDLPVPSEGARQYLEKHIPRLARTLALAPAPQQTGRVLELGCYMQITPLLDRACGYREVRGGYYGNTGKIDRKIVEFPDRNFECFVDHFDAERDPYPYPDEHFDLVIAGEIFEHMIYDPLFLLVESRRVLREGGYLLVSTPNSAGLACVFKALEGLHAPQIYSDYKMPGDEPEIGHMREYTLWELGEAVKAAGFEIDRLFATVIDEYRGEWRAKLISLLREHGYSTENRGEQSWCLARKRNSLPVNRYPKFLYSG
jgi:SAM-dependent methyltransferase